jgi:hypothetical protein
MHSLTPWAQSANCEATTVLSGARLDEGRAVAKETYRRVTGTVLWHSRSDCTRWPTDGYESSVDEVGGKPCGECVRKQRDHDEVLALANVLHGKRPSA